MPTFPQSPTVGLLTASELAGLRDAWYSALDQTTVVSRVTRAVDGYGGTAETYVPDSSPIPVLIEPVDTHEDQIIGARFGTGQIEYLARFSEYDTPPHENDRLTQCSDGHTYEVITIVDVAPSYSVNNTFGLRRLT